MAGDIVHRTVPVMDAATADDARYWVSVEFDLAGPADHDARKAFCDHLARAMVRSAILSSTAVLTWSDEHTSRVTAGGAVAAVSDTDALELAGAGMAALAVELDGHRDDWCAALVAAATSGEDRRVVLLGDDG